MKRNSILIGLVVAMVAITGCLGGGGSSTPTPTPAGTPTQTDAGHGAETATPASSLSFTTGLSPNGIDGDTYREVRRTRLRNAHSYTVAFTHTWESTVNDSAGRFTYTLQHAFKDGQNYRSTAKAKIDGSTAKKLTYSNSETTYIRSYVSGGGWRNDTQDPDYPPLRSELSVRHPDAKWIYAPFFGSESYQGVTTHNGTKVHEYKLTGGGKTLTNGEVTNGTVYLTERGRIVKMTYQFTIYKSSSMDTPAETGTVTYRAWNVGNTTVEQPAWV